MWSVWHVQRRGAEEWDGQGGVLGKEVCLPSLLGLALGSHSFHGFTHGLFIPQELHGLDGLQVLVQFIDHGNTSWQVQLHDSLFRETLQMLDDAPEAVAMGSNQYPFPLLDLGNYFFIPKGQSSGNSVLQTLTGG